MWNPYCLEPEGFLRLVAQEPRDPPAARFDVWFDRLNRDTNPRRLLHNMADLSGSVGPPDEGHCAAGVSVAASPRIEPVGDVRVALA